MITSICYNCQIFICYQKLFFWKMKIEENNDFKVYYTDGSEIQGGNGPTVIYYSKEWSANLSFHMWYFCSTPDFSERWELNNILWF